MADIVIFPFIGKRTCSRAATYPTGLCNAVLKGVQFIKRKREEVDNAQREIEESGLCSLQTLLEDVLYQTELEDMCEQDPTTWEELASQRWEEFSQPPGETLDSTTGEALDPTKVQEGCDEEMGFMTQMGVWNKVTRESAQNDPEGKVVGTRWVFVKKVDKVRCRLVAQEYAGERQAERPLRGDPPPLAATRYLLSDIVSRGRKAQGGS